MSASSSYLITLTGRDHPGITSALVGALIPHATSVQDLTQSVIQGQLTLSILCSGVPPEATLKKLEKELSVRIECRVIGEAQSATPHLTHRYVLTLIAPEIHIAPLSQVTALISKNQLNIDEIHRLSEPQGDGFNAHCFEMALSSKKPLDLHPFRKQLFECAKTLDIDLAFQPENFYRRLKRLVVLDMDSTLIQNEIIDELARIHGSFEEVASITVRAMHGKLDYNESLKQRCLKLKGLPAQALMDVVTQVKLTPGAEEMVRVLKKIGIKIALISGSFLPVAEFFRKKLGLDYAYANQLEIEGGRLTGQVIPPIVNAERKAELLESIAKQEGISLQQVIAAGDGANDLLMLEKAGLGVAFNAKPAVGEQAHLCIDTHDLRSILHLLGLTSHEIAEALQS